jgi:hypothetical protein
LIGVRSVGIRDDVGPGATGDGTGDRGSEPAGTGVGVAGGRSRPSAASTTWVRSIDAGSGAVSERSRRQRQQISRSVTFGASHIEHRIIVIRGPGAACSGPEAEALREARRGEVVGPGSPV